MIQKGAGVNPQLLGPKLPARLPEGERSFFTGPSGLASPSPSHLPFFLREPRACGVCPTVLRTWQEFWDHCQQVHWPHPENHRLDEYRKPFIGTEQLLLSVKNDVREELCMRVVSAR